MPDDDKQPTTITIRGPMDVCDLVALLTLLRRLNGPDDHSRHWEILVDAPGTALAEAEEILRRFFEHVSTHTRQ